MELSLNPMLAAIIYKIKYRIFLILQLFEGEKLFKGEHYYYEKIRYVCIYFRGSRGPISPKVSRGQESTKIKKF